MQVRKVQKYFAAVTPELLCDISVFYLSGRQLALKMDVAVCLWVTTCIFKPIREKNSCPANTDGLSVFACCDDFSVQNKE